MKGLSCQVASAMQVNIINININCNKELRYSYYPIIILILVDKSHQMFTLYY